jgi:hypothetical protein
MSTRNGQEFPFTRRPEMTKRRQEKNALTDRRIAISASYHTVAAAFARCCGTICCKLEQIHEEILIKCPAMDTELNQSLLNVKLIKLNV